MIGAMNCCTCRIVDDDIFPQKEDRTKRNPLREAEKILPSCVNVEKFLTSDEIADYTLIQSFLIERWKETWPCSAWGFLWSIYRAMYAVLMTFVVMLFVDFVWVDPKAREFDEAQDGMRTAMTTAICIVVVIATWVQSNTETYIVVNSKCGLTGKQLRCVACMKICFGDANTRKQNNCKCSLASRSDIELFYSSSAPFLSILPLPSCRLRPPPYNMISLGSIYLTHTPTHASETGL
jgi:hypothetical protein